jgi:glycosyltransferase involved in cell wall biosynthesis
VRNGHDVHVYTMHWWKSPDKTVVENGVTLHAISKYYNMYNGDDRRSIKQGVMFGLACLRLFRVRFDTLTVDHMPFFPIMGAWVVCKLRGCSFFGLWHEALRLKDWTEYMGKGGMKAFAIERATTKMPDCIIAVSNHTVQSLAANHGRDKRVRLITPGVDMAFLDSIQPAAGRCDILFAGRLVKDKNVDKLIEAVYLLRKTRPAVQCRIIGGGIEKERLQKLITKKKIQENVQLLGVLPNAQDVYAYMKKCTVFCLPSVREGFGMVALEALACGAPVVTVDSPANNSRYLIREGKNGSIVQTTPEALAQSLDYWLANPQKVSSKAITKQYDWGRIASQYEEVYKT